MKFNKKTVIIAVISAVIAGAAGFYFYGKFKPEPEKTLVHAITLKPEEIDDAGIYQGTLISRQSVVIQPQVSGQIAQINVKPDDKVQKGQVLLVIDNRKQEAALNSYKVKQASLVTNYENAKIQYERYTDLYEKKTVSKQDLENYTNAYKSAKSAMDENNALIKEQEVLLGYHKITAPFSGVVGDIPMKMGEYVSPETKLLSVTQNETLELNAGLPANRIFDLKIDLPVQILDFENNVISSSKLFFVSPRVDSSTQTILVKANFQNKEALLKADQSVKIRAIYNKHTGILIPPVSKTFLAGQDFVFVIKEKKGQKIVKQTPVTLGELQNGKYIVTKGLQDGDCIVTKGIQKLYDGAHVEIGGEE